MRTRRLYHRIYLSLLAVALLSIVGAGAVGHLLLDDRVQAPVTGRLQAEAEYLAHALPPPSAAPAELDGVVRRIGGGLRLELSVFDADGRALASSTESPPRLPPVRLRPGHPHWLLTSRGHALVVKLDDGRVVVARDPGARSFVPLLAVFFVLLAAFCLPVARRLTRRLESLEAGVERFGAGDLAARVTVDGRDEIASLARRFNWSAARIERLVEAQRRVLLSASHELRSPLARLRLALELVRDAGGPEITGRVVEMVHDVDDLDALVDDLLLASRLEAGAAALTAEDVDLAALVAEEGARASARVEVEPLVIRGDPRLLRRLVRNLLENAARHGGGAEVEAGLRVDGGQAPALLWVADRGPGVPEAERERIFEPFYRATRTNEPAGGVGLGLALVRQIAELHGGRARCRARDGGGSVFEVTLAGTARPTDAGRS